MLAHPSKPGMYRILTPREHAAVKRIPRDHTSGFGPTLAHTVLGNSVIFSLFSAMAYHLAQRMLSLTDAQCARAPILMLPVSAPSTAANTVDQLALFA